LDPRSAHTGESIPRFEGRREFHLHANDYYMVHRHRGRHTWKLLAQAIAGRGNWLALLDQNVGTLGNLAYQIEVSAFPAKLTVNGRGSTEARHAFLSTVLATIAGSAKVLLFHGRANDPEWGGRDSLAGAFLGTNPPATRDWTRLDFDGQPLLYIRHAGRLVLLTRALNGNVRNRLIDELHELISPTITALEIERGLPVHL
jgi:hypothetical protein